MTVANTIAGIASNLQSGAQAVPPGFDQRGGHLVLEGHDLVALANQYGTPLFVFSERRLRDNASSFLRAARAGHPKAVVCYASKAGSNRRVLRIINEEGLSIEVNSGGELHKVMEAGFSPDRVVFNGVAKSIDELRQAISLGIRAINVDSAYELQRIAGIAKDLGRTANVALRLVPGIAGGATAGIQTGNATSKFGMTAPELEEAIAILLAAGDSINVTGTHLHIGSQVAEMDAFLTAVKFAAEQRRRLGEILGKPLPQVNLGGGYPTNYTHRARNQQRASNTLDHFAATRSAAEMVEEVAGAARRYIGEDAEILFEPGRSLVADAAVMLSRVESTRQRGEQPWLYLDGGYNLLFDAVVSRWYFHMATANRLDAATTAEFRVVGPLCDSADCYFDVEGEYLLKALLQRLPDLTAEQKSILSAEVIRLPATRPLAAATAPGDIVALFDVGAYSLEEMFQYCGRLRAAAILLQEDGTINLMRERDSLADLSSHDRD
jgi:diaminopimelate decarboxylase